LCESTRIEHCRGSSGFALIEVLVALIIVGVLLTSIGALIASTVKATQALEQHVTLVETASKIEAGLPARGALPLGTMSGRSPGYTWRVDVTPFFIGGIGSPKSPWTPRTVTISVKTDGGTTLQVRTVRLSPRG
jgi:general secretion pathway protein I